MTKKIDDGSTSKIGKETREPYLVLDIKTALSSEETLKIIIDEYDGCFITKNENEHDYSALMSKALNFAIRISPKQLAKKSVEKRYEVHSEFYQSITEIYKSTVDELVKEKGRATDYAIAKRFNEFSIPTAEKKDGKWDATRITNLRKRLEQQIKESENKEAKTVLKLIID